MNIDENLQYDNDWQTQTRGTNEDEYAIYVANAEALGWDIKTYEEWLGI